MDPKTLYLGVDGGGTNCRARLTTSTGKVLGEAVTGPANLRLGPRRSFAAVSVATADCLEQAGLSSGQAGRIIACLALAGASEPTQLAAAQAHQHPFAKTFVTTDAHAACIGAHGEHDGGIIIAGTGSIGWARVKGRSYRVGGWGLPISDEGSGAWIGCEALRRALWAHDGRTAWTPALRAVFAEFDNDPHAIVRWTHSASPRDFGSFAPHIIEHATRGDPVAGELMQRAAAHIDALAARLAAVGAKRLAVVGGCARYIASWLSNETKSHLVQPAGDALQGALHLARAAGQSQTRVA